VGYPSRGFYEETLIVFTVAKKNYTDISTFPSNSPTIYFNYNDNSNPISYTNPTSYTNGDEISNDDDVVVNRGEDADSLLYDYTGDFPPCIVCTEEEIMTKPDAIWVLSTSHSMQVTCDIAEKLGIRGYVSESVCPSFQSMLREECGCELEYIDQNAKSELNI